MTTERRVLCVDENSASLCQVADIATKLKCSLVATLTEHTGMQALVHDPYQLLIFSGRLGGIEVALDFVRTAEDMLSPVPPIIVYADDLSTLMEIELRGKGVAIVKKSTDTTELYEAMKRLLN